MNYEKELNERQLEAVTSSYQHLRIIAGAGSGKTRVLTYRIAYLLKEFDAAPWSILAITFTNKVANEMKTRVLKMVPEVTKDLTIKTFHSFAATFLRHEIDVLNFPKSFTILDEEDQTKLIKDIASEMGFYAVNLLEKDIPITRVEKPITVRLKNPFKENLVWLNPQPFDIALFNISLLTITWFCNFVCFSNLRAIC